MRPLVTLPQAVSDWIKTETYELAVGTTGNTSFANIEVNGSCRVTAEGSTPEEAIANLELELYKKERTK